MEEEMIHRLVIITANTRLIHQRETPKAWDSKVKIWQWTVVHKKKATFFGTVTFQIPFQGKMEFKASRILVDSRHMYKLLVARH